MIDIIIVYTPESQNNLGYLSPHAVWKALNGDTAKAIGAGSVRSVHVIDGETGLSGTFRDDDLDRP